MYGVPDLNLRGLVVQKPRETIFGLRPHACVVLITLVLALLASIQAGLKQVHAAGGGTLPVSPRGFIWVVNTNVQEHRTFDSRHHGDMKDYVLKTTWHTHPHTPDVVLLQQVNQRSTRWLAKEFSRVTGHPFGIAIRPADAIRKKVDNGRFVKRDDSAILFNKSTIDVLASGKTEVTQRRDAVKGTPIRQVVPWAKVVELDSGNKALRMIATSIHYPTHGSFKNRRESQLHKARWSSQLSRFADSKMPTAGDGDRRVAVLGGDFNTQKCKLGTYDSDGSCRAMGFWRRLTRLGYKEPINRLLGPIDYRARPIIDFIFTRGNVANAAWDDVNDGKGYSDHALITALVEDEDTTPPWGAGNGRWIFDEAGHPWLRHYAGLWRGWDGGSGFRRWVIYRRMSPPEGWELIGYTKEAEFHDAEILADTESEEDALKGNLQYVIRAEDRVGHLSVPTILGW